MLLNARRVHRAGDHTKEILLAIEDVTERRRLEHERETAHARIAALLQELSHRIKNNLQIIVSMVSLEARSQKTRDGKIALESVSHRIAALGRLYAALGETDSVEEVDADTYLETLCRNLIESVQKENDIAIALKTDIERERLPAARDSARAHCERARHQRRQIRVPERDQRLYLGGAQAQSGRASPDGRR
jgi:chemotaxis protein methyltransferase CheR